MSATLHTRRLNRTTCNLNIRYEIHQNQPRRRRRPLRHCFMLPVIGASGTFTTGLRLTIEVIPRDFF
jgi:hypothetical protein